MHQNPGIGHLAYGMVRCIELHISAEGVVDAVKDVFRPEMRQKPW